jgi:predicted dehydrogenase
MGRAEAACKTFAEKGWGTPTACSYDEMLLRDDVDLVLNLTNPKVHYDLNRRALEAGKHVHAEKPLTVTREEGRKLLETAATHGRRLGCAPDTFLGTGHQTARALIDAGAIGKPASLTLFMIGRGPDGYHEDPEFFYQAGGGPLFDVGVYYITDAVHLLGPVRRVTGMTKTTFAERTVLSEKKRGRTFPVEVPTHVTGCLEFACGALGTLIASFDNRGSHRLPRIEIHGTEGSLSVPDPNQFGKNPELFRSGEEDKGWQEMPFTHGCSRGCRGLGAAELVAAEASGRPHRTSGALAFHVLDICVALHESAEAGRAVELEPGCEQPAIMPEGVVDDILA